MPLYPCLIEERLNGLARVCPRSRVVKGGGQRGRTFVEDAKLVAQQSRVGGTGLASQFGQALDVVALVFLDDLVNFRHDVSRLDGSVVEGAAAHLPARRRGDEQGEDPLAGCAVGGVRSRPDGVAHGLLDVPQVLLDDGSLTRKVLVESSLGDRSFAGESLDASGVDALAVEQVDGRVEDALTRAAATASFGRGVVLGRHDSSIPMGLHRAQRRVASVRKYTERYTMSASLRMPFDDQTITHHHERRGDMPSVLVTGAGRGIGLAITEHMSRRGWDVYATARSDSALSSLGRLSNVHAIPLDITDRASIAKLSGQLPTALNGVVNSAGIIVNGPVEGLSLDDLSRQLDVNVTAQIGVTQAVLPKIREARGRIVFMSSVSGLITTPGTGAYSASKYAVESLADALRMELRPWGIRVSLIEPGPIRTDMWGDMLDEHDRMVARLTDEHRALYASHLAGTRKLLGRMQKLAADPKRVTKAVDHALTSRRPKRRYILDAVSRAQKALVAISPTAINDAVLATATTSK